MPLIVQIALVLTLVPYNAAAQHTRSAAQAITPQAAIDAPAAGSILSGVVDLVGWAVDTSSTDGSGVAFVRVLLDGAPVKKASYGEPRDDIANAFGAAFRLSGWRASLDLETLAPRGLHTLGVEVVSSVSGATTRVVNTVQAATQQRFCINAHLLYAGLNVAATDLDRIRANGLTTVRFDVAWDALEPDARGVWNECYLARLDTTLDLVTARGLHPILVVLGTPAWARGNTGTFATPPTDPADFGDALGYLATRYSQRLGMTYEVWNEPNQVTFWNSPQGVDPAAYTRMLTAAYAKIKAVSPAAVVLGGSIVFNEPDYLEGMYAAGAGGSFDGLALHPYSLGHAPDSTEQPSRSFRLAVEQAQRVLAEHGDGGRSIWITEMGWSQPLVADPVRAQFYQQAVDLVRGWPQVASFCAYELNQTDSHPDEGLLNRDGSATASWDAYGRAARP